MHNTGPCITSYLDFLTFYSRKITDLFNNITYRCVLFRWLEMFMIIGAANKGCDVFCYCCSACVCSCGYGTHPKTWNVTWENIRYEKQFEIKHDGLWCSRLKDWHTALHSHSDSDRQAGGGRIPPNAPQNRKKKLASNTSVAGSDFHPTAAQ